MVENVNMEVIGSEAGQERIKELITQSEKGYIDSLHNVVFTTLQIEALNSERSESETEDEKKSANNVLDNNNKTLRANKGWMKQYEVAIPYFKSLLK